MRILGIAGYSGSGKTTLLTGVLPHLRARGLEVATLKHAHHGFDPLPPGHASQRWRAAGAREIVLAMPERHLLLRELHGTPEPGIDAMLPLLSPVDLLLVEGYKHGTLDKIEAYREANGSPLLAADDPHVIALATDCGRPAGLPEVRDLPIFSLDDLAAIAGFIAGLCARDEATSAGIRSAPPCRS
ncbi:MAG: molybdopterin-guanine dinucleotide biosynthesis protein B [Alphaproteobacteria bacterium]